ncbi:MAG TPA: cytochrome c oxidase accessory protein CcoG [Kofleriaceae bacterium]|jgi:cytochrome c oxidase accessory protein FixG
MTPPLHGKRVLTTLDVDGTRIKIQPRVSHGRFLTRRRIVAYGLIALFVILPRLRIGGRPAILFDLVSRELDVFGLVFRPSDGLVLMLLGLSIVLAVFLVTALYGRVWCGWGCPQSIYLEHLFRPVERWIEGTPAQRKKLDAAHGWKPRRIAKWVAFAGLSFVLANVFLAYFVGTDRLETWVFESPATHPGGFAVVAAVSAAVLFDFGYFREQTCILACPYGRLQSVLLDRRSSIIAYDTRRAQDCIDCRACVNTCPTGIDIRDGLQMECIGCAQCIDACDPIMDRIKRPRGLVLYTSQAELAGEPHEVLRVRTLVYPALLAAALGALGWSILRRTGTEVWVERVSGPSFVDLPDGKVAAQARIKIENETDTPRAFTLSVVEPDAPLRGQARWEVPPRTARELPVFVDVARTSFRHGERPIHVRIDDAAGWQEVVAVTLLGPVTP